MGIQVEFNTVLALRNFSEFKIGKRGRYECLPYPEVFKVGSKQFFSKKGQRIFPLKQEIPLAETAGNQNLNIRGYIIIYETTHFVSREGEIWTKGIYEITGLS